MSKDSGSKKLFISLPMNGIGEQDILLTRQTIYDAMKEVGDFELLETYFRDDPPLLDGVPNRLWYLGRSVSDLGQADLVIFAPGWTTAKGCVVEHLICEIYKIPYIHWAETTDGVIKLMAGNVRKKELERMFKERMAEDDLR